MKSIARSLIVLTSLLSSAAFAQWQWLDKDGRKVFSDRAPPASVPDKAILKRPGQSRTTVTSTATDDRARPDDAQAASTKSAASAPKISGVDKELAEKKMLADQAEAAKHKAEDDKARAAKADNCVRAKNAKAGMDSGVRMGRINAKGEREIMDDAARATEASRIQGIIASDCN